MYDNFLACEVTSLLDFFQMIKITRLRNNDSDEGGRPFMIS